MTESLHPITPAAPRRGRRLAVAGMVAGGFAVVGGAAGAVAAAVSHAATPSPAAGPSLFFPAVGQAQGGGAPGGGAMATSLQGGAQDGMAAPALAQSSKGMVAYAGSFAYPSPACGAGASQPATATGDGITATGVVQLPLGSGQTGASTLNVGVQSNQNEDFKAALADVRNRLDAIRAAVERAGIPDADISVQNLGGWSNEVGPKPVNANANGQLTVLVQAAAKLDQVIGAAIDAGANNVNLWSSGTGTATPSDDQVRSAVSKAAAEARGMAQAEAQGAGLTLGAARGVSAAPPAICPWAPGGPQLVVAVTVTYATK